MQPFLRRLGLSRAVAVQFKITPVVLNMWNTLRGLVLAKLSMVDTFTFDDWWRPSKLVLQ